MTVTYSFSPLYQVLNAEPFFHITGINDSDWTPGYGFGGEFVFGLAANGGATFEENIYPPNGVPSSTPTNYATGINDLNQIVGYFQTGPLSWQGFLETPYNNYTVLQAPGASTTYALGINDHGLVAGWDVSNGTANGFIYDSNTGSWTTVIDPQADNNTGTRLLGINDSGQMIDNHGFAGFYNGSTWSTIADPNAANGSTNLTGINDAGMLVGIYNDSSGNTDGFVYDSHTGSYTTIAYPGATRTFVTGINNNGQIVGDANGETFIATLTDVVTVAADHANVQVGTPLNVDVAHGVLVGATDSAGNTLHVTAVNGQASEVGQAITTALGALTLNADGSFHYTANASDTSPVSEDVFQFTAGDGQASANATLTVTITAAGSSYTSEPAGATVTAPSGHMPVLDGSAGNDTMTASNGGTVLIGGPGDTLTGGNGSDTFVFLGNFGANKITNYNPSKDLIEVDHNEFANIQAAQGPNSVQAATHQVGSDVVIDAGQHGDIVLQHIQLSQLTQTHFNHFLLGWKTRSRRQIVVDQPKHAAVDGRRVVITNRHQRAGGGELPEHRGRRRLTAADRR
jgi:VCBS repeat-containing protein